MRWRIRSSAAGAGQVCAERLWRAAMPPSWPVLTAGIAELGEGLVAEAGSDPAGFAAVDMAGSIPRDVILVDPACQRRGIGTGLLAAALERIRAGGVADVTAASGGSSYIWPGISKDLPAAVRFFASCGWRHSHDTLDLVTDLARYRPPPGVGERAASTGVTVMRAASTDLADVLAFEASAFPSWLRWFSAAGQDVLIARDSAGTIAGTLLLDGPGANTGLPTRYCSRTLEMPLCGRFPRAWRGHGLATPASLCPASCSPLRAGLHVRFWCGPRRARKSPRISAWTWTPCGGPELRAVAVRSGMSPRTAQVRIHVHADVLGLGKILADLRNDVTYSASPDLATVTVDHAAGADAATTPGPARQPPETRTFLLACQSSRAVRSPVQGGQSSSRAGQRHDRIVVHGLKRPWCPGRKRSRADPDASPVRMSGRMTENDAARPLVDVTSAFPPVASARCRHLLCCLMDSLISCPRAPSGLTR